MTKDNENPVPQNFWRGHITIFVSVFAVDDSVVNNERTLTIYISQCSAASAAHAGVVMKAKHKMNRFGKLIRQSRPSFSVAAGS